MDAFYCPFPDGMPTTIATLGPYALGGAERDVRLAMFELQVQLEDIYADGFVVWGRESRTTGLDVTICHENLLWQPSLELRTTVMLELGVQRTDFIEREWDIDPSGRTIRHRTGVEFSFAGGKVATHDSPIEPGQAMVELARSLLNLYVVKASLPSIAGAQMARSEAPR